ncbi:MAG: hypothetical protein HY786_08985, partial [Deltaproteobacteria bacterium]|nr:hypothetical protein [Deltaproteobacteria bacterium]
MFKKTKYLLAATALLGMAISGCQGAKTEGSVSNPSPSSSFQPKGTVAGVLTDSVTNDPIANATIYIMDKSAVTNAGGSFTIANISANLATGNETGNPTATDPYQVVIDLKAVNDAITAYNAVATNTTKKAYYPSFAYTTATVKYDSLGDATVINAGTGTAGTSATNHDTPVDGFVASIAPKVGPLSANVKIQVVNKNTFANISGAAVELISQGSGYLTDTPTGNAIVGTTGHIVATGTTDTTGLVTFSGVEAGTTFLARATSSDGTLSGITGDGNNNGAANKGPVSIATEADNVTVSYLLNQLPNNALMISPVEDQFPIILSATPELNSDLTVPTTGGQDVVFTF